MNIKSHNCRVFLLIFAYCSSYAQAQKLKDIVNVAADIIVSASRDNQSVNAYDNSIKKDKKNAEDVAKKNNNKAYSYEIKKVQGLYGCDATALYQDSTGSLWLGTGSSGGVYKYDEAAKEWRNMNNGIGAVHINSINEIEEKIVINYNKEHYAYYENGKNQWTDLSRSQVSYVSSQIANKIEERKVATYDWLMTHKNIANKYLANPTYLNDIIIIDDQLYLLDTRGLLYINKDKETIDVFNEKGLEATDIFQIIPTKDGVYVWTNSQRLMLYGNTVWTTITEIPRSFHLQMAALRAKKENPEFDEQSYYNKHFNLLDVYKEISTNRKETAES